MRLVLEVDHGVLGQPPHAAEEKLRASLDELGPSGEVGVEALDPAVVERQHVVLGRFVVPELLELGELLRHLRRQVVRLAPVRVGVVELPDVLVETGQFFGREPRCRVAGHGRPAVVVDAAVAEHLEVLRRCAARRRSASSNA